MTATNQEAMHASICGFLGTTPGTWESDWHALWDSAGIADGPYNARMLAWLNQQLGASYTNLPGAQAAYAAIWGASSWSALGSINDADADAYFVYSGTLTAGRKALITTLVRGIKTDLALATFATGFDAFWILAQETSAAALKNIAKDDHHCAAVAAPTFEADRGYAGNGTTSYLTTDYIPSTDAVSCSQNSIHISIYNRTNRVNASTFFSIGARQTAPSARDLDIGPRHTSASFFRLNDVAASIAGASTSQGFWVGTRNGAATVQKYRNAVALTPGTDASVGLPNVQAFICARNSAGTPDSLSTDQHAFASIGKVLSATDVATLTNRVESYMDAIGAGVI